MRMKANKHCGLNHACAMNNIRESVSFLKNRNKKDLHGVKSAIRGLEGTVEVALLTILYYLFWRHGYDEGIFPAYYGNGKYVLCGVYALLTVVLFFNFEGFKFGYLKTTDEIVSQWVALLAVNFITYWQLCLIANKVITPMPILALTLAQVIVCVLCTYVYSRLYHHLYVPKNMVMIYGRDNSIILKFKMDARNDKYHISRLISEAEGTEYICQAIVDYDAVIINDVSAVIRNDILKFCYKNHIRTYITPKLSDIIVRGAMDITLFDTPLLLVKGRGLTAMQRIGKRCMDVILCLLSMVVVVPIMLCVAIAIKLEDGGPVFYKQKRVTVNGKVFDMLKFRSMIVDAEKDGKSIPATDNDPRVTKVGRFIRATRIDELPQILNILKGEMSIVGPRPERVEHVEMYSELIPEFDFRLKVKGGLTGYAQIYGKYNTSPYDKLRLDMMYIEKYSLMLDIKLILMTIRTMLKKESTEGFDRMEELELRSKEVIADLKNPEHTEADFVSTSK